MTKVVFDMRISHSIILILKTMHVFLERRLLINLLLI